MTEKKEIIRYYTKDGNIYCVRTQAKASALIEMVQAVSKKHEELKKFSNGREDYENRAEESFDRIFENTLGEIETLNASLRNRRLFSE